MRKVVNDYTHGATLYELEAKRLKMLALDSKYNGLFNRETTILTGLLGGAPLSKVYIVFTTVKCHCSRKYNVTKWLALVIFYFVQFS
jgi:hypothetical protein